MRHRWEKLGGTTSRCGTCGLFRSYQGRASARRAVYRVRIGARWLLISPACADPRQATITDIGQDDETPVSDPIRTQSSERKPPMHGTTLRPVHDSRAADSRRSEWERTLFHEGDPPPASVATDEHIGLTLSRFGRVFGEERNYRLRTGTRIGTCVVARAHSSWPGMLDAVMLWLGQTHHKSGTFLQLEVDEKPIARWTLVKRWTMEVLNAP